MARILMLTEPFNQKRYGQPWIAKIDFSQSAKGEFSWGEWAGDIRGGSEGTLVLDAEVGDIIAEGQKDNRNPSRSRTTYYAVLENGKMQEIGDKGKAYKVYLNGLTTKDIAPNPEKLLEEKEKLEKRVIEINKLLEEVA